MIYRLSRRSVLKGVVGGPLIFSPLESVSDPVVPTGFVSVRKFGARGDGETDDTDALTSAHASGAAIYYPATVAFYKISQVLLLSASTYSNGAEIRIVGDGTNPRTIFRVKTNSRPTRISGFVLDGGYGGGTKGEFSHGIDLLGANNVTVSGNTIRNTYGDCVCINASIVSSNIRIHNNRLLNPRRCNVAVVCGEDIAIENNLCVKTSDYVTSIDLEPDHNGFDFVRRVSISHNKFNARKFISAGVNNGADNARLSIIGNTGRAMEFFHGWESARLREVTVLRNRFSSIDPGGAMLILEAIRGGIISENIDDSPCAHGYRSVKSRDCDISFTKNKFCV